MRRDGSTLHPQHHVEQHAPLSEGQQAVQQAPEVGWTPVGVPARASRVGRTQQSILGLVLRLHVAGIATSLKLQMNLKF